VTQAPSREPDRKARQAEPRSSAPHGALPGVPSGNAAEGSVSDEAKASGEIWSRPLPALMTELGATAAGLSGAEAEARLLRYGPNQPVRQGRRPLLLRFLQRFLNPLVLILLFASALSATTGNMASSRSSWSSSC